MELVAGSRIARPRAVSKSIIGTWSPEFSVSGLVAALPSPISTGLPSANDPWAFPFRLSETVTLLELLVMNGSAAGGNFDMGVYDSAFAAVVRAGSTAGSGNSAWQVVNVTDTVLLGGKLYYLVLVRDNATANRQRSFSGALTAGQNALAGTFDSATDAFPLPDPLTNMAAAATITQIPVMGFTCKAAF